MRGYGLPKLERRPPDGDNAFYSAPNRIGVIKTDFFIFMQPMRINIAERYIGLPSFYFGASLR